MILNSKEARIIKYDMLCKELLKLEGWSTCKTYRNGILISESGPTIECNGKLYSFTTTAKSSPMVYLSHGWSTDHSLCFICEHNTEPEFVENQAKEIDQKVRKILSEIA